MNGRRFALALFLTLAWSGHDALRAQSAPPVGTSVLQAGDRVRITVWQKPELSGEFQVAGNGTVADPFYQEVRVGGVELNTAADRIRAHLAQYETSPRVLIEPLLRVAVAGEVRRPDVYWLPPESAVSLAVMLAGGPTERGRLNRVQVIRGNDVSIVDLARPHTGLAAMPVRSGDQIVVQRQSSFLRDYIGPTASVAALVLNIVRISRLTN